MNIRAKQFSSFDITRMDITTSLGYYGQIKNIIMPNTTLVSTLDSVWTTFTSALQAFDTAYAQARKWEQTADIEDMDRQRDNALSAFLNALKAMQASPNATKAAAAKTLTFIRDKYTLSPADEYMKETTAISQMIQEIEANAASELSAAGLDDWLADLKQKNEAFLAKMNERTEAQAGQQKGILREMRLRCEAAYRDLLKLINALTIVEIPAGFNYDPILDRLNAEVEHYRQILARKGISTGSTNSGGGYIGDDTGENTGGGTVSPDPGTGGSTGGGSNTGGGETPDPGTGGGDDQN